MSTKGLTKDLTDKFSITIGARYFSLAVFQNYLVFMPAIKYINQFHATTKIYSWKSNGISEESIENIAKSESNFALTFVGHYSLPNINFNGHCLIKSNISIPKK